MSGRTGDVPAEEYLCTRIRRAEQALMGHHEAVLRGYGLTMTQYTVLLAISREGGMSGAQLARSAGVTQQTMAAVLTGLDAKQLARLGGAQVGLPLDLDHVQAQAYVNQSLQSIDCNTNQHMHTMSRA